ncbi:OLC1v1032108C1 [Oldenlandia corymbosa var. corymbosa]|uniref:Pectinesterase n=1 Tax=Oldenlandia corymbosa var. corymbosa TaxID=529605 RepID=A0AAV1CMZ6_OLDCO|nr:OLC1v1032108C1 [Oldenlandia corymbosa var. corymbosa]
MDKLIPTFSFLFVLIFLAPTKVANAATSPSSICSQTPYPELCHSLTITPKSTLTTLDGETSSSFNVRDASLKFSLAQAQYVHNLISTMDTTSFDKLTKAAWVDCFELYEDTIDNLARCSSSIGKLSDAQTWLSAAYANHETCKNGFLDFQLNSKLQAFPFFNTNFSKHLSNSLAINKVSLASSLSTAPVSTNDQIKNRKLLSLDSDGFPAWVSTGDRKLLQATGAPKANIVVAQDGSGNYKTISEALAASSKLRSGSSRFVIHVKRGVYKENVVVTKSMTNIMMVGDGIDVTVVTGNKNVVDGSTTFNSATFGEFIMKIFFAFVYTLSLS